MLAKLPIIDNPAAACINLPGAVVSQGISRPNSTDRSKAVVVLYFSVVCFKSEIR